MAYQDEHGIWWPHFSYNKIYLQSLQSKNFDLYNQATDYLDSAMDIFTGDVEGNFHIKLEELTIITRRLIDKLRAREEAILKTLQIVPEGVQGTIPTLTGLLNAQSRIKKTDSNTNWTRIRQEQFTKYFEQEVDEWLKTVSIGDYFFDNLKFNNQKLKDSFTWLSTNAILRAVEDFEDDMNEDALESGIENIMHAAGLLDNGKVFNETKQQLITALKNKTNKINIPKVAAAGFMLEAQVALDLSSIIGTNFSAIGAKQNKITDVVGIINVKFTDSASEVVFKNINEQMNDEFVKAVQKQVDSEIERTIEIGVSAKDQINAFSKQSKKNRVKIYSGQIRNVVNSLEEHHIINSSVDALSYLLRNSVSGAIGESTVKNTIMNVLQQYGGIFAFDNFEEEYNLDGIFSSNEKIYLYNINGKYYSLADILETTLNTLISGIVEDGVSISIFMTDASAIESLRKPYSLEAWNRVASYVSNEVGISFNLISN